MLKGGAVRPTVVYDNRIIVGFLVFKHSLIIGGLFIPSA